MKFDTSPTDPSPEKNELTDEQRAKAAAEAVRQVKATLAVHARTRRHGTTDQT